jgi:hypothetical protein
MRFKEAPLPPGSCGECFIRYSVNIMEASLEHFKRSTANKDVDVDFIQDLKYAFNNIAVNPCTSESI